MNATSRTARTFVHAAVLIVFAVLGCAKGGPGGGFGGGMPPMPAETSVVV